MLLVSLAFDTEEAARRLAAAGTPPDRARAQASSAALANTQLLRVLCDAVRPVAGDGGAVVVAAAGDDSHGDATSGSPTRPGWPAAAAEVVSVAAVGQAADGGWDLDVAPFSNGPATVYAPGVDVLSAGGVAACGCSAGRPRPPPTSPASPRSGGANCSPIPRPPPTRASPPSPPRTSSSDCSTRRAAADGPGCAVPVRRRRRGSRSSPVPEGGKPTPLPSRRRTSPGPSPPRSPPSHLRHHHPPPTTTTTTRANVTRRRVAALTRPEPDGVPADRHPVVVVVEEPFDVVVGLDDRRDRRVTSTGAIPADVGTRLTVMVTFDPASLRLDGDRSFVLDITAGDRLPTRTLRLTALDGDDLADERRLCVHCLRDSTVVGIAWRSLTAVLGPGRPGAVDGSADPGAGTARPLVGTRRYSSRIRRTSSSPTRSGRCRSATPRASPRWSGRR